MEYNKISGVIPDAYITVHEIMGPVLFESIYEAQFISNLKLINKKPGFLVNINFITSTPVRLSKKSLCSLCKTL